MRLARIVLNCRDDAGADIHERRAWGRIARDENRRLDAAYPFSPAQRLGKIGKFATDCKVANIERHCADFAEAQRFDLPPFDGIVAHRLHSWEGEEAQKAMRDFVERRLKP